MARSEDMTGRGDVAVRRLSPSVIDVNGDRALAMTWPEARDRFMEESHGWLNHIA